MQAARHLVAVLVELAAGVQLGHHDFGGAALRIVLVVHLQAGRHAAAVVGDRDRVVRVDDHLDVVAMPGERFVDRVVEHFEHEVVQTGAIRCIPDVHPRPLAHGVQTFEDLDGRGAVAVIGLRIVRFSHGFFPVLRYCKVAALYFSKRHKNAKGALRPLVFFLMLDVSDAHRHHHVLEFVVLGNRDQRAGAGITQAHLQHVDLQIR
ncbi:hypothetical protein HDG38_000529 [Paraburkholderia sp. WSM4177]|nr:hypothetical protein [Paraburkholderia sp. WSM4177]MBB5482336.1 hypothetical protein [Paraburkholderia sp. WSM4180]